MAQAAATIEKEERLSAIPREAPEIDPANCRFNSDSAMVFREMVVRLPRGFIADDLKEPSIWKRVQGTRGTALRRHDHLYLIASMNRG